MEVGSYPVLGIFTDIITLNPPKNPVRSGTVSPFRAEQGTSLETPSAPGSRGWAEDKGSPNEGECFRRREARSRGLIQG